MCGIAGVVLRRAQISAEQLEPVAARLRHRGPDDKGLYCDKNVGLVHTRLSIIDLAGGHQPIENTSRDLAIIVNGEIYNYVELREELVADGTRFATHSDSEVPLRLYERDPDNFLEPLRGMYALALYDKTRQRLILARDRLGIKPLVYAIFPDRVIFASEIKALLPLMPIAPEVDPGALGQFLQYGYYTSEQAILRWVSRLGPGESLSIDTRNLDTSTRRYWDLTDLKSRALGFDEAAEEFDLLFRQVMTEHIRSDVPFGLFLSGGNDSAVLAAMLHEHQDKAIRTFSVGYSGVDTPDELDDAERIARLFGTEHTALRLDRETVFHRLPFTVWAADDLMVDYASLPTSILSQAAAKELKVVFSGEGGDEVFAGYGTYRTPLRKRILKAIASPGSGGLRTQGLWRGSWPNRLFGSELRRAAANFRGPVIQTWQRAPRSWSFIQRAQYLDLSTKLTDQLLVKADRMSMAVALEARVPFLDHRVVEFGLSLPDNLKIQGRNRKVFLRRWAEPRLPKDHLYAKKRGFYVPVEEWLQGNFLDRLESKLQANAAIRRWFNSRALPSLFQQQRSRGNMAGAIWGLMHFAIWHGMIIDGARSRPDFDEDPLDWID
jgi:asparagine synthase (glutamine-hydrolysing)